MVTAKVCQIDLGDITIDVTLKEIKNIHLGVYPPHGRVRIAAPARMSLDTIRVYAISKLPWIRKQQQKLREQEREAPREYLDRESHYVWGKRYLLKLEEVEAPAAVVLRHRHLVLRVRPDMAPERRQEILEAWYRQRLKEAVPALLQKWAPVLGVHAERFFVQRMKTKWGGCTPGTRSIRLNTELAKKPPQCLEYIVVHELMHLLEPTHSSRFIALMDQYMPKWRFYRGELNKLPVRHEHWLY